MPAGAILAIDQGTTNTKALLVDGNGDVIASRSRVMQVAYPQPGWAEQSATAIWEVVAGLIGEVVAAAPHVPIEGVAIANQRETIVLWDAATGEPVAPAILWQCQRSADRCAALAAAGHGERIAALSGLDLNPLFPAAKIGWLLDATADARRRAGAGHLRCGTIDSWLVWKLTGGAVHATDHGNASRTQLLNLDTLAWDAELLALFGVPAALLPEVRASDAGFGAVAPGLTALADGTPIRAVMGDSHAALFGHGIATPGRAKVTIGTGSSMMTPTAGRVRSRHGLSGTIAWSRGGTVQHALEGNISVSGQAAAFTTTLLGLEDEEALTLLAASVADTGGVVFVPALAGLGAPHWHPGARGLIEGMTLGTRPAHIARATLEAIALQIADVLAAMEADLGTAMDTLSIDGGAARNALLARMLADLAGVRILRPELSEASALGVARMAMGSTDVHAPKIAAAFAPTLPAARRDAVRRRWRQAVARAAASGGDDQEVGPATC